MVEIVDGDVTLLAADANDGAPVGDIVVKAEGRDGGLARELCVERESFHHADVFPGLLELIDKDLLVDQGESDKGFLSIF